MDGNYNVATHRQELVSSAIGLIQSLVDDESWYSQFRIHFEEPELFNSLKLDLRADMMVFDLFVHNPENLEKLINHRILIRRVCKDSTYSSSTAEGARQITLEALQSIAARKT